MFVCLGLTSTSISASSISDNGLTIKISTNQTEYNQNENIQVDLSITNENDYSITLIEARNVIPKGFKVDSNSKEILENTEISVGETIHLQKYFITGICQI